MTIDVRTDIDAGLARASIDGASAGRLGFHIGEGTEGAQVWTLYTTVVDPAFEGRGIGSALVRDVIAAADAAQAQVDPTCWFVAGWLDRHPEYHHMLTDDLH